MKHLDLRPIPPLPDGPYIPVYVTYRTDCTDLISANMTANGIQIPFSCEPRPDIQKIFADHACYGMYAFLDVADFHYENEINLRIDVEGIRFVDHDIALSDDLKHLAWQSRENKRKKSSFVRSRIICPICGSAQLAERNERLHCGQCRAIFQSHTRALNLVPRDEPLVPIAANASFGIYDACEMEVVEAAAANDAYVLDFGAGPKPFSHPNVVCLELSDAPSTDIIACSDKIPFQDDTFDAIICLHVLEHVSHPAEIVKEFMRILKPSGRIVSTVPQICPLHGFPNHYFNMTFPGHASLFSEAEIVRHFVKGDGHPMNALKQIASTYYGSLPENFRQEFGALTIGDIVGRDLAQLVHAPSAAALPDAARREIAAHSTVIAQKRALSAVEGARREIAAHSTAPR